jgi:uncharacterized protein (TIGR02147 family)
MTIFEATDYKSWVNWTISKQAKGGRGQFARMAQFLRTSSAIITQVFKGDRDLTPDQAVLLAEFLGLTKLERQCLILLVNHSRAASVRYQKVLEDELAELRQNVRELKHRVRQTHELTAEAKATLYSNWYYLAIWSLCAIDEFSNIDSIVERLKIPRSKASAAIEFLTAYGLIILQEGRFKVGPTLIHLESNSPHLPRHHQNWRSKAFQKYDTSSESDVSYTAPVTLSESDAEKVREMVLQFISKAVDVIKDSPSEKLYCLCMDWFEVK